MGVLGIVYSIYSRKDLIPARYTDTIYIYIGYFCYLLQGEYKNFVDKRLLYLIEGDPDTPAQGKLVGITSYSVYCGYWVICWDGE